MTTLPLVFDAPKRALPPRHLADLDPAERRSAVGDLGLPGIPRGPARPPLLRPAHRGRRRDDRPAGRRARGARHAAPAAGHTGHRADLRRGTTRKTLWRGHDGTLAESVLMGYPDRATVCISSQAGCGMACPFCATGPGRAAAQPVDRGDRGPGAPGGRRGPRRRARRADAAVERRVHGHGRAAGQLQARGRGAAPDHRPRPGRPRDLRAWRHGLDRRAGPGDRQAGRRGPAGHSRRVPARPGRRAARHPGAGQQPVEGRRGPRRGPALRDHHGPPRVDRVRADPRRQRPAVAGGPARQAPAAAHRHQARARQPHPAQPDARAASGTPHRARCRTSSSAVCRPPAWPAPSATPAGGRSPPPAASSRPTGAPSDERHTRRNRPGERHVGRNLSGGGPFVSAAQTLREPEGQTVRCAAPRDAAGQADAGQARRRRSRRASSTSPSGTGSARSSSATATRSRSAAATRSR